MRFELPIYGENDELLKTYKTDKVRWAVFIKAVEVQETIEKSGVIEQMQAVNELLKSVFIGLTDDELLCADSMDIMSTFKQIVGLAGGIKTGNSKNG